MKPERIAASIRAAHRLGRVWEPHAMPLGNPQLKDNSRALEERLNRERRKAKNRD